jgi:hypothetical protein
MPPTDYCLWFRQFKFYNKQSISLDTLMSHFHLLFFRTGFLTNSRIFSYGRPAGLRHNYAGGRLTFTFKNGSTF